MKDRLLFEKIILANGIRVYAQVDDSVPFAEMSLIAPLGHAHNSGEVVPGTFHYLEHILMKRSERYPKPGSLKAKASLLGGQFGASTWFGKTAYNLIGTSENFDELFKGVCSHFFTPVFNADDIASEAGIISNERKRSAAFYPQKNFMTQYMSTQWVDGETFPIDQKFGSDDDMIKMTKEYFEQLHQLYKTKHSYLVIAGNFDLDSVCKELESYETVNRSLPERKFKRDSWNKRYFHEVETIETSRFNYHLAALFPVTKDNDQKYRRVMSVMHAMLMDYSYGILMKWLRHEKKWCYEIPSKFHTFEGMGNFELMVPLNSFQQVDEVRQRLQGHVLQIFDRPDFLEMVKQHKRNLSKFWYQTISQRMKSVCNDLHVHGSIETEAEYYQTLDAVTVDDLQFFFTEQLRPNIGELLFVPQK